MRCPICKSKLDYIINDKSCNVYKCINNHSFDESKTGYVNLLVNKSLAGDNKEMINARHEFLMKDYYLKLALKIKEIIKKLNIDTLIDVGCGEGYFDRIINDECINITGIDISKDAINLASKKDKKLQDIFHEVGIILGKVMSEQQKKYPYSYLMIGGGVSNAWYLFKDGFELTNKTPYQIISNSTMCPINGVRRALKLNNEDLYLKYQTE